MVRGYITKDDLCQSYILSMWVLQFESLAYVMCGKWIHGRCAEVKREMQKFPKNITCKKCKGTEERVEQEETICDEVETVR